MNDLSPSSYANGVVTWVFQIAGIALLYGEPKSKTRPPLKHCLFGVFLITLPVFVVSRRTTLDTQLIYGMFALPCFFGGLYCLVDFGLSRSASNAMKEGLGVGFVASGPSILMTLLHYALTRNQ